MFSGEPPGSPRPPPPSSAGKRPMSLVLAHGGIPGLIAETSLVFVGLGLFGYFIRRSAKKEQEREEDESKRQ
jgi:hypothetical protein